MNLSQSEACKYSIEHLLSKWRSGSCLGSWRKRKESLSCVLLNGVVDGLNRTGWKRGRSWSRLKVDRCKRRSGLGRSEVDRSKSGSESNDGPGWVGHGPKWVRSTRPNCGPGDRASGSRTKAVVACRSSWTGWASLAFLIDGGSQEIAWRTVVTDDVLVDKPSTISVRCHSATNLVGRSPYHLGIMSSLWGESEMIDFFYCFCDFFTIFTFSKF